MQENLESMDALRQIAVHVLGLALFTEPCAGNECETQEAACNVAAVLLWAILLCMLLT